MSRAVVTLLLGGFSAGLFILVAGMSLLTGCRPARIPTYAAGGQVMFADGRPLEGGMVIFRSVGEGNAVTARGFIQPDGTFQLSTFESNDGAIEGPQQAVVMPPLLTTDRDDMRRLPSPPIDAKFSDFGTSGLKFTVSRIAAENNFKIFVEPP